MKPYLLDVNVLLALTWPSHVHHTTAKRWFFAHSTAGFRTCPITESGLVRISSNSSFTRDAVSPAAALALLNRITCHPRHGFWPDDVPVGLALRDVSFVAGHRQITDGYLIALAESHDGIVATLDRGLVAVATGREHLVELVQSH